MSQTSKHTKGPWSIPHFAREDVQCNCQSVLAEPYMGAIAEVFFDNGKLVGDGGNDCPPIEEAKANARLMAAAPELLEALQAMEQWYSMNSDLHNMETLQKARQSITKALGE